MKLFHAASFSVAPFSSPVRSARVLRISSSKPNKHDDSIRISKQNSILIIEHPIPSTNLIPCKIPAQQHLHLSKTQCRNLSTTHKMTVTTSSTHHLPQNKQFVQPHHNPLLHSQPSKSHSHPWTFYRPTNHVPVHRRTKKQIPTSPSLLLHNHQTTSQNQLPFLRFLRGSNKFMAMVMVVRATYSPPIIGAARCAVQRDLDLLSISPTYLSDGPR
jgi:hypothetical protein